MGQKIREIPTIELITLRNLQLEDTGFKLLADAILNSDCPVQVKFEIFFFIDCLFAFDFFLNLIFHFKEIFGDCEFDHSGINSIHSSNCAKKTNQQINVINFNEIFFNLK